MAEEKLVRQARIKSFSRRALISDTDTSQLNEESFMLSVLEMRIGLYTHTLMVQYPASQIISLSVSSYSTMDDVIFVVTILHEYLLEPYVDEDETA